MISCGGREYKLAIIFGKSKPRIGDCSKIFKECSVNAIVATEMTWPRAERSIKKLQVKNVLFVLTDETHHVDRAFLLNQIIELEHDIINFSELIKIVDAELPYAKVSQFCDAFAKWPNRHRFIEKLPPFSAAQFESFTRVFDGEVNELQIAGVYSNFDKNGIHGLHLHDNYVLFDVGAYRGSETRKAISFNPNFEAIYCFEPSRESFRQLEKNVGFKNIYCRNTLVGDQQTTKPFNDDGTMGARIENKGETLRQMIKLDNLGVLPSHIKIDVEGYETDVLNGAADIIKKGMPDLAIAIYHHERNLIDCVDWLIKLYPYLAFRTYTNIHMGATLYASANGENLLFKL